jgi:hypothetical protein
MRSYAQVLQGRGHIIADGKATEKEFPPLSPPLSPIKTVAHSPNLLNMDLETSRDIPALLVAASLPPSPLSSCGSKRMSMGTKGLEVSSTNQEICQQHLSASEPDEFLVATTAEEPSLVFDCPPPTTRRRPEGLVFSVAEEEPEESAPSKVLGEANHKENFVPEIQPDEDESSAVVFKVSRPRIGLSTRALNFTVPEEEDHAIGPTIQPLHITPLEEEQIENARHEPEIGVSFLVAPPSNRTRPEGLVFTVEEPQEKFLVKPSTEDKAVNLLDQEPDLIPGTRSNEDISSPVVFTIDRPPIGPVTRVLILTVADNKQNENMNHEPEMKLPSSVTHDVQELDKQDPTILDTIIDEDAEVGISALGIRHDARESTTQVTALSNVIDKPFNAAMLPIFLSNMETTNIERAPLDSAGIKAVPEPFNAALLPQFLSNMIVPIVERKPLDSADITNLAEPFNAAMLPQFLNITNAPTIEKEQLDLTNDINTAFPALVANHAHEEMSDTPETPDASDMEVEAGVGDSTAPNMTINLPTRNKLRTHSTYQPELIPELTLISLPLDSENEVEISEVMRRLSGTPKHYEELALESGVVVDIPAEVTSELASVHEDPVADLYEDLKTEIKEPMSGSAPATEKRAVQLEEKAENFETSVTASEDETSDCHPSASETSDEARALVTETTAEPVTMLETVNLSFLATAQAVQHTMGVPKAKKDPLGTATNPDDQKLEGPAAEIVLISGTSNQNDEGEWLVSPGKGIFSRMPLLSTCLLYCAVALYMAIMLLRYLAAVTKKNKAPLEKMVSYLWSNPWPMLLVLVTGTERIFILMTIIFGFVLMGMRHHELA